MGGCKGVGGGGGVGDGGGWRAASQLFEVHHLLHQCQGASRVHLNNDPYGIPIEAALSGGHAPLGGVQTSAGR